MEGETVSNFRLLRQLGVGGMGEVWLAEQQLIKTRVAVKFLLAQISSDRHHVQRFFNEAIAVSKIRHAGIARIFDVGFHGPRAFLIMELLEGETLAARIRRTGRLSLPYAAELGRQIASILEATHREGITHRDLKPDNVFLVPDAELAIGERVKVLDFGIAKLQGSGTGLTGTGGTMGTPDYMAPEQWTDAGRADARADIYSFGCMLFEAIAGRVPFVASSVGEACTKHLHEVPPRVSQFAAAPPVVDDLLSRMLAKDPAARPAVREIAATLAEVARTSVSGPGPTLVPGPAGMSTTTLGNAASWSTRPPARPVRWPLLAGGVVVVGGIVATVVATRKSEAPAAPQAAEEPVAAAVVDAAPAPAPVVTANDWVRIEPPATPYLLGVSDKAPASQAGFRAARKLLTPSKAFAIQQHEVTWSELDAWLAANNQTIAVPAWVTAAERAKLPASGVTWTIANRYCQSIGATLPTDEQWELAARGATRREHPWGDEPLDVLMTRAFAGADAAPVAVMTSQQDRTPEGVYDLAGNVQEWTLGLWRDDHVGDESSTQTSKTTVRAIRGVPLAGELTAAPRETAAYRERLCATGPCVEKTHKLLARIGFRCVKNS